MYIIKSYTSISYKRMATDINLKKKIRDNNMDAESI